MIQIKKTILTLVALLAVTTGAWAQGPWTSGACTVTLSGDVMTVSGTGAMEDYLDTNFTPWYGYTSDTKTIVIESGVTGIGNFAFSRFEKLESVSIPASVTSIGKSALGECGTEATTALTVSFAEGSAPLTIGEVAFRYANLKSFDIPNRVTSIGSQAFYNCSNLESVSIPASVTSIGDYAFYYCGMLANVYIYAPSLTTYGSAAFADNASGRKIHVLSDAVDTYKAGWSAYAADIVGDLQPLASGPDVAWNKAEKTGTFTMPGGNVTLEPEYYPQAALATAPTAINDVPATTDGAIVEAGTVKNIGETTNAQGTVMYYVSQSPLDDAALLALAADQWTADVPTAAGLAQGQAYVYYYVRGNDGDNDEEIFSDGDIKALQVTLGAAPLWNAEFDLTNAPEEDKAGKWSTDIPEGGVVKGTEVKVTYSGTKKVIGVKAEKKAAAPASNPLDNTTTAWTAGTYVVPAGGLTYSAAITVSGDVTLTLTDGETLTLNKGISLASGATLTVEGNGAMVVNGTNNSTASTVAGSTGTLILTSGTLTATGGNGGSVGNFGDNNHGGNGGDAINGSVIVSGGTLTARGGNGGSIGVSSDYCSGGNGGDAISGTLTINGGSTSVNDGSNGSIGSDSSKCTAGTGGKAVAGTVTDNRN